MNAKKRTIELEFHIALNCTSQVEKTVVIIAYTFFFDKRPKIHTHHVNEIKGVT